MKHIDRAAYALIVLALLLAIVLCMTACRRMRRDLEQRAVDKIIEKGEKVIDGPEEKPK